MTQGQVNFAELLLQGIKKFPGGKVTAIPQNSEKFLSIVCEKFMFLDSMMFLSESLENLVKNLLRKNPSDGYFSETFSILEQALGTSLGKRLARKGVYPYEYMNSWDRFEETEFPTPNEFFSSLSGKKINGPDYEFGKSVFDSLCTNMGDYHDLYLYLDSLLLACVFENFREVAITNYRLDPCHYFSLAGYAWDAALLATRQKLEQITDPQIYNMLEMGLRGGVSMISQRNATANNRYMDDFKAEDPESYLLYIDKNNLYGEALLQHLPVSDFEFESNDYIQNLQLKDILKWKHDDDEGRILMVDLEYPNEFPLAPEKIAVKKSELSEYQQNLISKFGIHYSEKQKKLVPHLSVRRRYVHYRNLQYYISKGMRLRKVHSIIRFTQKAWLKDYVLFNAKLRIEAQNDFEKNLYKFFVNSIFGKSMEQVRCIEKPSG
jgi:uncharacterized protein YeeX (DUF496 family)